MKPAHIIEDKIEPNPYRELQSLLETTGMATLSNTSEIEPLD